MVVRVSNFLTQINKIKREKEKEICLSCEKPLISDLYDNFRIIYSNKSIIYDSHGCIYKRRQRYSKYPAVSKA